MINNDFQKRVQHFATLKTKYQASDYEDSSPSSPLYLILRKTDLGIELTEFELNWLKEQKLHQTSQFISEKRVLSSGELLRQGNTIKFQQMRGDFSNLKSKYEATHYILRWQTSPLYFILCKLDSGYPLTDSEMKYLQDNHLDNIVMLVTKIRQFVTLKVKLQATQSQDSFSVSILYSILERLEKKERLSDENVNWLKSHELFEILAIFQQQESVRKAEFSKLKAKYQATTYPESHVSNPLYQILQNLDTGKPLTESELQWLKEQELVETFELAQELEQHRHFAEQQQHFAALKKKYKATQDEDSSPSSHLYQVLKQIALGNPLSESDLKFLRKRQLTQTRVLAIDKYVTSLKSKVKSGSPLAEAEINWLIQNGREDIIIAHLKSQLELGSQLNSVEIGLLTHKRRENLIITHLQSKLNLRIQLNPAEIDVLKHNGRNEIMAVHLKSKLELENQLNSAEFNWLKQNGREDIITLAQVASLKSQVESGHPLSKAEIDWLKQKGREDIITFAIDTYAARLMSHAKSGNSFNDAEIDWLTQNGREDIIIAQLKSKAESGKTLTQADIDWLKQKGREDIISLSIDKYAARLKSKAKSGNSFTEAEIDWLTQNGRKSIIIAQLKSKAESGKTLTQAEINWLKHNGGEDIIIAHLKFKAKSGSKLSKAEINWLTQKGREDIISLAIDKYAARLKSHAKSGNQFTQPEIDWLTQNGHEDIITFAIDKYTAKLKSKRKKLTPTEINWLKNNGGDDILIAHFKSKVESGNQLTKTEINWLKQKKHEDIITLNAQLKRFVSLKSKYGVSDYRDDSPSNRLYAILQQLEKGKRLEATDVVWLTEKSLFRSDNWRTEQSLFRSDNWRTERSLRSDNRIFTTYHKIEATFYEQEYKRTENKWNLPSASSHWRSAQKPEHALALTDNLNFDKIKENKLKSALLTTRGGAFRDMGKLGQAEQCARQAMKYQPNSHHPYTLMGAICYDRSDFLEGDNWFKEAIKRGASPRDIDAEIKRVFKNADNNKRLEILAYLQKTNHRLYKWANSMLR